MGFLRWCFLLCIFPWRILKIRYLLASRVVCFGSLFWPKIRLTILCLPRHGWFFRDLTMLTDDQSSICFLIYRAASSSTVSSSDSSYISGSCSLTCPTLIVYFYVVRVCFCHSVWEWMVFSFKHCRLAHRAKVSYLSKNFTCKLLCWALVELILYEWLATLITWFKFACGGCTWLFLSTWCGGGPGSISDGQHLCPTGVVRVCSDDFLLVYSLFMVKFNKCCGVQTSEIKSIWIDVFVMLYMKCSFTRSSSSLSIMQCDPASIILQ